MATATTTVLHIPQLFFPDPVGGAELFVDRLARALEAHGVRSVIAAPAARAGAYEHDGVPVRRFPVAPTLDLNDLYGAGDPVAARAVGQLMDTEHPALIHLHAVTPAISLRLVREAARRRLPVILTYHAPMTSCQRGTLLRWGHELCDGRLDLDRCTACTLHHLGVPRPAADLLGRVPVTVGRVLGAAGAQGGAWTALRLRALMAPRLSALQALFQEVTHAVAVCQWVHELLERLGVPPARRSLCRYGVPRAAVPQPPARAREPLRLAMLGRFHPTKGFHLVVDALRRAPALPIVLDLYGLPTLETHPPYLQSLRTLAAGDRRITFHPTIPSTDAVARLAAYDAAAVPSQWLETGPLVVLEAFAAGVPVVGSRRGGIAELVTDGADGLLVEPPESVAAWGAALARLCEDPALLPRLRAGIQPVRTMATVAAETAALYRRLGAA